MLTLQFVPYTEIKTLSSIGRIRKILNMAKENKVVLLEGRLSKEEEAELIKTTMEEINASFKGIELAVIGSDNGSTPILRRFTQGIAKALAGDTDALTIIGPGSIVKEIKKDPKKIELLLKR